MDTIIVVMEKDSKTGFLEKEIVGLELSENQKFIVNIYVMGDKLYMKLSDDREISDWEYDAIYDYFDDEVFGDRVDSVSEVEDTYDPTWEIVIDFDENDLDSLNDRVEEILAIFASEINSVYDAIKDKEGEYTNEEE